MQKRNQNNSIELDIKLNNFLVVDHWNHDADIYDPST